MTLNLELKYMDGALYFPVKMIMNMLTYPTKSLLIKRKYKKEIN